MCACEGSFVCKRVSMTSPTTGRMKRTRFGVHHSGPQGSRTPHRSAPEAYGDPMRPAPGAQGVLLGKGLHPGPRSFRSRRSCLDRHHLSDRFEQRRDLFRRELREVIGSDGELETEAEDVRGLGRQLRLGASGPVLGGPLARASGGTCAWIFETPLRCRP